MVPTPNVSNLKKRARKLAEKLRSTGLEGVIMAPGPNLRYYTGVNAHLFERPFLLLVKNDGDAHLLAPKLEAGPFRDSIPLKVHSWDDNEGPSRAIKDLLKGVDARGPWGCDGRVPFGFLHHLLREGLKVKPADDVLQGIREVKEADELEVIKRSASMLSQTILKVPEVIRAGMSEKELARFIVEDEMAAGADEVDAMVQSGVRAADPHSDTSSKKIRKGESVVVDVVSSYGGYAADITRTFILGGDSSVEKIYNNVLAAQQKAIDTAKVGVSTGRIDAAARDSLKRDGLAKYFIHRTGHGLGLEVHEAPYIVSGGRERLAAGMVFTVEPGAYIPGKLGVRIEDDVAMLKDCRREVLSGKVPKEYGWWK